MRKLLIVAVVAAGLLYWFLHRPITEAQVAGFYATQVEAFGRGDQAALCAQYAPEYKASERQVGPAGVQALQSDKALACRTYDFLFEFKKKFDAKQTDGGILATEFHLEPDDIQVAKDGKSASVHLKIHLNFGGAFYADGVGTDHLVMRGGKLLSVASEMETHVSGPLAVGIDPASLMTPSGR